MSDALLLFEIRHRKDKRGVDLISPVLSHGRLWFGNPHAARNALTYARSIAREKRAIIQLFDERGGWIQTFEHAGEAHSSKAGTLGCI